MGSARFLAGECQYFGEGSFRSRSQDAASQPVAIRHRLLVALRTTRTRTIGNHAEHAGEPFLSSLACRTVARDVQFDRRRSLCCDCRSMGRLRPPPQQSGAGAGSEKHFQVIALLIALALIVKILYVSQYFPPEMGAPAARAAELSRHWAAAGHEVTVLTGFPNHPTGVVPPEYRSKFWRMVSREITDGVNVVRTWLLPLPNRKAHERMLNYSSFCVSAASTGLFLSRPDVVIATSPQLLVGLSGWWLARWKRVPFVFEVRDLWPESLAAVGMGSSDSLLHRVLAKIAGFLYRRSDRVVVVTPAFED